MTNILIGAISGIVSGMGMGGGTILILCLSLFLGKEQHVAQGANLIFFYTNFNSIYCNKYKTKINKMENRINSFRIWNNRSNNWSKHIDKSRHKKIKTLFWNISTMYSYTSNIFFIF